MDSGMDIDGVDGTPKVEAQDELVDVEFSKPSTSRQPGVHSTLKDLSVKVHIRRPERDSWVYVGRAVVNYETSGSSGQVVVRSVASSKVLVRFTEISELQAERRGNFVVVGIIDGAKVVSWSLNALNSSDTLKLLSCIQVVCHPSKLAVIDPTGHHKLQKRVERLIKEDRRKRHKRRKEADSMVEAFSRTTLGADQQQPIDVQ
ncbi:hypothetical protein PENSPDRAFT_645111 [Peniophora sp. CONT]|nr:hypothetical protein PENSPDRAFT_645111 [Peniophora sp. CONT]